MRIQGNLNTDFLKILGLITMSIDHIGKVFYPESLYWQLIGRITFPIFGYCLVVGFLYTSNFSSYFKRVVLFAALSQPFYVWAFGYDWTDLNIFFTLSLGLLCLWSLAKGYWLLYPGLLLAGVLMKVDYGLAGLLFISLIYVLRKNRVAAVFALVILFASQLFINLTDILHTLLTQLTFEIEPAPSLNVFGMASLLLVYLNRGLPVRLHKSYFYLYYPGHLFLLMIARHIANLLHLG